MMDVETTFFSLLQTALFGRPLPMDEMKGDIDWESVWSLAGMHTVEGLIGEVAIGLPEDLRPPQSLMAQMRRSLLLNLGAHGIANKVLARCVTTLRRGGIEPILLKGQGLASLYPRPQSRTCGDIDLFVGEELYDSAWSVATAELADADGELEETAKHRSLRCGGVEVELHRWAADILKSSRRPFVHRFEAEALADHSRCNHINVEGCDILLPPADFNAIYVFLHLWFHFQTEEGIGLRQLCDWAMLLHRHSAEIDHVALEQTLRRMSAVKGWQMMGHIVVDKLGLPAEEMPLYTEKAPRMTRRALRRVMTRGNFGYYAPDRPGEHQRSMSFLRRKRVRTVNFFKKYWDAAQFAPIDFTLHFAPTIWRALSNSTLQLLGLRGRGYVKPGR